MRILSSKKIINISITFSLLITGYFLGNLFGKNLLTGLISGENSFLFILYQPAYEYINTIKLLGSSNDSKRLIGYYSLLDNNKIDVDFLIERYKKENSTNIKRSIIWLLGYSKEEKKVNNFLSEIYRDASGRMKTQILRTIKRIDHNYYHEFIKDYKIDANILKGI